jgi:hypothetical protein
MQEMQLDFYADSTDVGNGPNPKSDERSSASHEIRSSAATAFMEAITFVGGTNGGYTDRSCPEEALRLPA